MAPKYILPAVCTLLAVYGFHGPVCAAASDPWGEDAVAREIIESNKLASKTPLKKGEQSPSELKVHPAVLEHFETRLKALSEEGNVAAQCVLGTYYETGLFGEKKPDEAMKWEQTSADAGYPKCELGYGMNLYNGKLIAKNIDEGLTYLKRSSAHGDPQASYFLATEYYNGTNLPINLDASKMYAQKGADDGYAPSFNLLGAIAEKRKDLGLAFRNYTIASELGDTNGKSNAIRIRSKLPLKQLGKEKRAALLGAKFALKNKTAEVVRLDEAKSQLRKRRQ